VRIEEIEQGRTPWCSISILGAAQHEFARLLEVAYDVQVKLIRHGALYVGGTIAPILVMLVVTPFVTRLLGPSEYGFVALFISITQAFAILASLGLSVVITRHVIVEKGGLAEATRLMTSGVICAFLIATLAAITTLLLSGGRGVFPWVVCAAFYSGAAMGAIAMVQSLMRGTDQPVRFVLLGMSAALLPPAFALSFVYWWSGDALAYVTVVAVFQIGVAAVAVAHGARKYRGLVSRRGFVRSLAMSLPTIPHSAASALTVVIVVGVAAAREGNAFAGQIQIAALLGTSIITILTAVNNAWSPIVLRAPMEERAQVLRSTTGVVACLSLIMSVGFVMFAPILLPIIAGPVASNETVRLSILISSSGAIYVAYLANIHATFVSGRTWPLAISSPASTFFAATALLVALNFGGSGAIVLYAVPWLVYHAFQAAFSLLLAAKTGLGVASLRTAALPLCIAFLLPVFSAATYSDPSISVAADLAVLVSGVIAATLLFLRRRKLGSR